MKNPAKLFGKLTYHPGKGAWHIEASPAVAVRLKRLFPRIRPISAFGIWVDHTDDVCRDLEMILGRWPMEMTESDRALLNGSADSHRDLENDVESILNGKRLEFPIEVEGAHDYQVAAADLAYRTGGILLADPMGLGKTLSSLLVLRSPDTRPALIVTLTHLPDQWVGEIRRWMPQLKAHVLKSTKVYDPKVDGETPDVIVTSYSKLASWADYLMGKVSAVIFDEVQELRRSGSLKYEAATAIAEQAIVRMGLSGTPVYNYGGEIYNVVNLLRPDALGSRSEFEREWGRRMSGGQLAVADPEALGSYLYEQGIMLRRTWKDVGRELPPVNRIVHPVESDPEKMRQLSEGTADLADIILNSGDREQVFTASGQLDIRMRHATGIAKAVYVAEFVKLLLEEGHDKVLLLGWHHDVYDVWEQRLIRYSPVRFTGRETPQVKARARDEFVNGESRVLMMSLRAGAGLDGLQEVCNTAVFGELDWSPGMHEQCIGRLHRGDIEVPVFAYFLVSDQGTDPIMADVLSLKKSQADGIHDPYAAPVSPNVNLNGKVKELARAVKNQR